VIKAKENKFK